jgi:hypothetical protein
MKPWQIVLLVVALIGVHLGAFALLSPSTLMPRPPAVPRPNFVAREKVWTDPKTGETLRVQEYQVSTRLENTGSSPSPW